MLVSSLSRRFFACCWVAWRRFFRTGLGFEVTSTSFSSAIPPSPSLKCCATSSTQPLGLSLPPVRRYVNSAPNAITTTGRALDIYWFIHWVVLSWDESSWSAFTPEGRNRNLPVNANRSIRAFIHWSLQSFILSFICCIPHSFSPCVFRDDCYSCISSFICFPPPLGRGSSGVDLTAAVTTVIHALIHSFVSLPP